MSSHALAYFHPKAIRTERDIEYDAFLKVTSLLHSALVDESPEAIIISANENVRLWTSLLIDLSQKNNLLRDEVKAGLISIGMFSVKQSLKAIAGNTDLMVLIDINVCIMRGLRGESEV